jgi:multiple antibiotic resistance protein
MDETGNLAVLAAELFPLLFNLMGPIGVIPAFAALSTGMSKEDRKVMANRAAFLAFIALAVAVFMGASILESWSISNGSLIFAGGVIVLLTALQHVFGLAHGGGAAAGGTPKTPRELAVTPLAFPTIASPRPIAVLIIFVAAFNTLEGKLTVLAVGGVMLLLNIVGMRNADWFMEKVGMTPLLVLGAVFGVLQVALGVEMMANGYAEWSAMMEAEAG